MSHPITLLLQRDADRIEDHLLRLSVEDRSLRFAAGLVTDETIRRYVRAIPFDKDYLFGLLDDDGNVVGLVHGCTFSVQGRPHVEAALSVDAARRGGGVATALLGALIAAASERSGDGGVAIIGSCAARNLPMRSVFGHGGMALHREDDEIQAHALVFPSAGRAKVCCGAGPMGDEVLN